MPDTWEVKVPLRFEMRGPAGDAMEKIQRIILAELDDGVRDCVLHVQERVKWIIENREQLVNEGHLINSITNAKQLVGSVIEGYVGSNVMYAKYQEYGTIPHFVPFHLAKSLYNEAIGDWGWIPVTKAERARLNIYKGNVKMRYHEGAYLVTGRHQTYWFDKYPDRLWAKPTENSRPVWGVFVSGRKRPFLYPGWAESVEYILGRLDEAGERAAARIQGEAL